MQLSTRIKVGWEILKGDVKSAFDIINPATYRGDSNGMWFFGVGNEHDKFFSYDNSNCSLIAYKNCPPVSAIINRKAIAYSNGKNWILNNSGKAKDKEATSDPANKIRKLMAKPNPLQSGKQFESQAYILQQLFGYAVVLLMKPFGYPNIDATSMWILPNWLLEITEGNEPFYNEKSSTISQIVFTYKNVRTRLPLDNILILKDFTPCIDSAFLPQSRVSFIEMPINNIIGAYESRNVLINKRGPQGFLTQEASPQYGNVPMKKEEKDDLQRDFARYGLKRKQLQVILAGTTALKWQSMGYDVGQLKLMEEVVESSKSVCDEFGYPPHLLGLIDPTFNNQKEAQKGLYTDTIIPEAASNYEQWNSIFNTSEYGITIMKDYSEIPALQEDKQQAATARKVQDEALEKEFKNNLITLNRWLVLIDEDPRTDEFGEKYYYELLQLGWKFGDSAKMATKTAETNINE